MKTKRLQASEGRRTNSRSVVERAIDRAKSDKTGTWDDAAKEGPQNTATWASPYSEDTEKQ
jgi:hypothetical protein